VACAHEDLEAMFEALQATGMTRPEAVAAMALADLEGAKPYLWDEVKGAFDVVDLLKLCGTMAGQNPEAANWAFGAWLAKTSAEPKREGWRSWLGLATEPQGIEELILDDVPWLRSLPPGLIIRRWLRIDGSPDLQGLPADLRIDGSCQLKHLPAMTELPKGLAIGGHLEVVRCDNLKIVPADLKTGTDLQFYDCPALTDLPAGLAVGGSVMFHGCGNLRSFPNCPSAKSISFKNCLGLTELPLDLTERSLFLVGCSNLKGLPPGITEYTFLNLCGCRSIEALPDGLKVTPDRLFLDDCVALRHLPKGLEVTLDLQMKGCEAWDGQIPEDATIGGLVVTDGHPEGISLATWRELHPQGERPCPKP
jgi:hypothetical protein